MTQRTFIYLSWLALLGAIAAFCGVAFFAWIIAGERSRYAERTGSSDEALAQQTAQARLHALVSDSAQDRARLETLVGTDLLSAVNVIESVGKNSGVKLRVSGASPEGNATKTGQLQLYAVGFVVGADGSFSALMQTAKLLESLPLPVSIGDLDISRAPIGTDASAKATWHMNARIRLLTTTNISS